MQAGTRLGATRSSEQGGGARALGLRFLGGDVNGGLQESRRSLAGQTGALASSWVKDTGPAGRGPEWKDVKLVSF